MPKFWRCFEVNVLVIFYFQKPPIRRRRSAHSWLSVLTQVLMPNLMDKCWTSPLLLRLPLEVRLLISSNIKHVYCHTSLVKVAVQSWQTYRLRCSVHHSRVCPLWISEAAFWMTSLVQSYILNHQSVHRYKATL